MSIIRIIRNNLKRLIERKSPLTPEIETSSNPKKDDVDPIPILNYFLIVAKYNEHDYYLIIKEEKNFDHLYILGYDFHFKKMVGIYTLYQLIKIAEVKEEIVPEIVDWRELLQRVTNEYKIIKEYNIK